MEQNLTARARYSKLETVRQPYLDRARDSAEFTIPSLITRDGYGSSTKLYTPYQGIGARGLNNLASKLLLALLPPNQPFFRLSLDEFTIQKLTQQKGMQGEFEKAMGSIERVVMNEIEVNNFRTSVFEALRQLIVAGNVLLYITPELTTKVYKLDEYVIKRDSVGNVIEIITKDVASLSAVSEEIEDLCHEENDKENYHDKQVSIYTRVIRSENKKWLVQQEVNDKVIPSSIGSYPLDKSPFIPLRYTLTNEDYGRGFVEEYIGDLRSLEALYRAVVEGSAAASKVLFLVRPNGTTRIKTLSESPNGAIREGDANDVTTLQMNKSADFSITFQTIRTIEERLTYSFMLMNSVQRQADRVTATEIRLLADALNDSVSGLYSLLSQELQLPLISRLMYQMEKSKRLPTLPKDSIKVKIVTGLEALGRSSDLQRLNAFVQQLTPFAQELFKYVNFDEYVKRVGTSLGIDMEGLIKSPDQLQMEEQIAQQQAMMQQSAPAVVKEGAGIVRDSFKAREEQQQLEQQQLQQEGQ
jgi:hypothetical protein